MISANIFSNTKEVLVSKAIIVLLGITLLLSTVAIPSLALADDTASASSNAQSEVIINDEEIPMGVFDTPRCWTHWVIGMGIVATLVYGTAVVGRRYGQTSRIQAFEAEVLRESARSLKESEVSAYGAKGVESF